MKLFKQGGSDYQSTFKNAERYLNAVEKAADKYVKSAEKGKKPSDDPTEQIRREYTMAGLDISELQRSASTPKERESYQKLRDRFERVSGTVARALEMGAMSYVTSARGLMDTGDSMRIDDQIRDETNRRTAVESESEFDRHLESLGEEGKRKAAEFKAQREQRKKADEERFAKFGGVPYSNIGYSNAERVLAVADDILGDAAKAAENSGSSSSTGEIESAKAAVADARRDLESRQKSGK